MGALRRGRRRLSTRRLVQLGFLVVVVVGVFVVRGNAERWCPFGGVEAIYTYVHEGNVLCSAAVSNFFVLGAVLLSLLLLRRAFCAYACPIGTVSEWLQRGARRLGVRPRRVPPRLDAALSLLKVALLVVIVFFTWRASELVFRAYCPAYALLGRHGEDITYWAYVVSGGIVLLSLVLTLPFCRWLCPLAALMNVFSRFGVARVGRDGGACANCGKCARACPMGIPVDEVGEVVHARCTACLECVDVCPTRGRGTLALRLPGPRRRPLPRAALVGVFLLLLAGAVVADQLWPLPSYRWSRGTRPAAVAVLDLEVASLACRGRATLFVAFLDRSDDLALDGYLLLEAWPDPEGGRARITYDPRRADAAAIQTALTEAYFDARPGEGRWWTSPFRIAGYDPLGLDPPGE